MVLAAWMLRPLVEQALREDLFFGDPTTEALVPEELKGRGVCRSKEPLVVCGLPVAREVFRVIDPELELDFRVREGERVEAYTVLFEVRGRIRSILQGERVALNFLQHLSGIATLTRRFVEAVQGFPVRIVDTRKTIPGLRYLEKYAVRVGGGHNHRLGLSEGVLIKDNHIRACGGIREAIKRAREKLPHTFRLEVEVSSLEELEEALSAGAEVILLDNLDPPRVREAVARARSLRPQVLLEVSGGVTLENVRAFAETGVDLISVGRLTHSAPAVDIHLKITETFN